MGIDYSGVGGAGIEITEQFKENIFFCGVCTEDEWNNNCSECLEKIGITWSSAGNAYTGDERLYWFIPGERMSDVIINTKKFIEDLAKVGVNISLDDIIMISDVYIS